MLKSSNPTAAFHSICSWKLLWFSLPLLVSCHSRSPALSPSRGCIFLPWLPWLMSESFHLTKSLLSHGSPVSLHLCQGPFHMSEHFNDIWCWDRGREQQKPNTIHSWGEGMGRSWKTTGWGGRHLRRVTLEKVGPAECSAPLSPFPQSVTQRKRHFLRVSLSRTADPALHLYS